MTAPTLETDRLRLRPYVESDRDAFVALNGDPVVRRNMNGPRDADAANALFDRVQASDTGWAVCDSGSGAYLGHAFLTTMDDEPDPELGFMLATSAWGRGFATEAAASIVRHALDDLGIERLIATADNDNPASIRILEKLGFTLVEQRSDEYGPYGFYSLQRAAEGA